MSIARSIRQLRSPESLLLGSILVSNALNFLFSTLVGRTFSFETLALFSLINTLLYLSNIVFGAFAGTVNHQVSYLMAKYSTTEADGYIQSISKHLMRVALVGCIGFIVSIPLLMWYFHVSTIFLFISFVPVIWFGLYGGLARGFANGRFLFVWTGAMYLTEAIVKLLVLALCTREGWEQYIYLSIPISVLASSCVGFYGTMKHSTAQQSAGYKTHRFSRKFFTAALLNNIATNAFLTFDVLLVTHYLQITSAGIYALLAIIGKMIFFFGTMFHIFVFSFVSADEGKGINPNRHFYFILAATTALCTLIFLIIGPFGFMTLPMLFPLKARSIIPYTTVYGAALVFFTIANTLSVYHLARKHFSFTLLSLASTVGMLLALTMFHTTIGAIVTGIFWSSLLYLLLSIGFHLLLRNGGFLIANLIDFVSLFSPIKQPPHRRDALRILILNWRDLKHIYAGGAEVYIHECAKRWVKQGHAVTIFCGNDGLQPRFEVVDGVYIIRRGGFYMVYFWAFMYYALKLRGKFDIILDCENGIPFFSPLYAREKVILLIHHVHQEVFRRSLWFPFSWIASMLELKVMPHLYQSVPFITVSPSTKQEIIRHELSSIEPEIVYGGIDTQTYIPGKKSATPEVLYLGRLKRYKSVHTLIDAMARVIKKIPDAHLIIAGDGEESAQLKALVQKRGLGLQVQFVGRVDEAQKIQLYQRAWVFVQPSFIEGWGITIIESNACGTPVIASRVSGLKDSVLHNKTGKLVTYGDTSSFADEIETIITDDTLRARLSHEAHVWAQQFDWNISAEKAIALMKSVLTHP